jgi:hypothetical protein
VTVGEALRDYIDHQYMTRKLVIKGSTMCDEICDVTKASQKLSKPGSKGTAVVFCDVLTEFYVTLIIVIKKQYMTTLGYRHKRSSHFVTMTNVFVTRYLLRRSLYDDRRDGGFSSQHTFYDQFCTLHDSFFLS